MIAVACKCGKVLKAKDEDGGKSAKCPGCGARVYIPVPQPVECPKSPDVGIDPSAMSTESAVSCPFWKDPVFIVGATVPGVILLFFLGYLLIERSKRSQQERIIAVKLEADKEMAAGRVRSAHQKFNEAIDLAAKHGLESEQARDAIEQAKKTRDRLEPMIMAEIKREAREKERREQLAEEEAQAKLAAEAKLAREKEEDERYAKFSADVTGGAWIVNKAGKSDILRGLSVHLIRLKLPRGELDGPIKGFEFLTRGKAKETQDSHSDAFTKLANHFAEMGRQPPTDRIDMAYFYTLARQSAIGDEATRSNNGKFAAITQDDLWRAVVPRVSTAKTMTNIDGKYEFKGVPGGRYYIYAIHATDYALIEWVVPLEVATNGMISKDLFNDTAVLILNKDND